ncbi:MAG: 50S ribosomal protein L17 [Bacteroidota bacterium]
MRHLVAGRKLGRTASHRKATLSALSVALIQHKKIRTTTAKAKEARKVVERLITKAKNAVAREAGAKGKDVHSRRDVFAFLRDRGAVSILFNEIAQKVATRPGGYTRVVKLGRRHGDGAEVAVLELVDFNVGQDKAAAKTAEKPTQPRKKQTSPKKAKAESPAAAPTPSEEPAKESAKEETPAKKAGTGKKPKAWEIDSASHTK